MVGKAGFGVFGLLLLRCQGKVNGWFAASKFWKNGQSAVFQDNVLMLCCGLWQGFGALCFGQKKCKWQGELVGCKARLNYWKFR